MRLLYPADLLPYYPTPPFLEIDNIIFSIWDEHLRMELESDSDSTAVIQHLEVTAAIIDFWENKLNEINEHEVRKRRSNSHKDSR